MRIGISCYDISVTELVELSVAAEERGFSSVWLGEHVLAPAVYASLHPPQPGEQVGDESSKHGGKPIIDPSVELTDPMTAFAAVASRTRRLRLATGIFLMPLRHPLLVARAAATLAELSGERFSLGIGSGWLREEFTALAVPFKGRTKRLEEQIAIFRAALSGGPFSFRGDYYQIDDVQMCRTKIAVPVITGGNTEPALARAVRLGDAWFSSGVPTLEQALRIRDRIAELCRAVGRPMLPTTWRVAAPDPKLLDRYAAEGFEDVVVMKYDAWVGEDLEARRACLSTMAERLEVG
jgi:probable F420-dependent oxidoreductase